MNKRNLVLVSFGACLLAIVWAWFRLQTNQTAVQVSKDSFVRCQRIAQQIEISLADSTDAITVASSTYEPGSNVFAAMGKAGIDIPPSFNVSETPPMIRSGGKLLSKTVEFQSLELTMPQIIKFVTAMYESGVRHQVDTISLEAADHPKNGAETNDVWICDFEISYFVDASNK